MEDPSGPKGPCIDFFFKLVEVDVSLLKKLEERSAINDQRTT